MLGTGPLCTYHYTTAGNPILAFNESPADSGPAGVVKLNGELIALSPMEVEGGFGLAAGSVRLTVLPEELPEGGEQEEAVLRFEVGDQLSAISVFRLRLTSKGEVRCEPTRRAE